MSHFKLSFWPPRNPESNTPNFWTGFKLLHEKLGQSKVENEELLEFIKNHIQLEEHYAAKMKDQSKTGYKSSGFGRDDGATLKKSFDQLKENTGNRAEKQSKIAAAFTNEIYKPLQKFHEEFKRSMDKSRGAVESMLKQFDGLVIETEKSRNEYYKKCKEFGSKLSNDKEGRASILLGTELVTQEEFDHLVDRMKNEIKMQDHSVPCWGTYKYTSTGEDISRWLNDNFLQCKESSTITAVVGQQLITPYKVIRLISEWGSQFNSSKSYHYQWISEANTHEINSTDTVYREDVKKLNKLRMEVEEAMCLHLDEMEKLESNRIEFIKSKISKLIDALEIQGYDGIEDWRKMYDTIEPDKDICYIATKYFTSDLSPISIAFKNYNQDINQDQLFGLSLKELCNHSKSVVPPFIINLLRAIEKRAEELKENKQNVWIMTVEFKRKISACLELNQNQNELTVDVLEKYEPELLVNVLLYFLVQLPDCLMTSNTYELISKELKKDEAPNIIFLVKIIASLPISHYFTLKAILGHLRKITENASTSTVHLISDSVGSCILWPKVKSYETVNSKIPAKWIQLLLENYGVVFNDNKSKDQRKINKERLDDDKLSNSTNISFSFWNSFPKASSMTRSSSIEPHTKEPIDSPTDMSFVESGYAIDSEEEYFFSKQDQLGL
ncbi:hypothetical protein G6F62_010222 [Rhizopus arrhizus]|nr:hypothetical protein G6F62_010222 [Rhizopus arrhizus]